MGVEGVVRVHERIEENAGGMSGYVKAMFALIGLNPKGNGKIFNA